jgi:glycogen debranching enzyme
MPKDSPPELEPEAIQVLEGSTFMVSDKRGDVRQGSVAGLFHEDTRFLSKYELTVGGRKPTILTSDNVDYYSAGFFLTNPRIGDMLEQSLSIQRHRFVGTGLHDDLILRSHVNRPIKVTVRLSFGADFADLFEVKGGAGVKKMGRLTTAHDARAGRLRFDYVDKNFRTSTAVEFTQQGTVDGDDMVFEVQIGPREMWKTCIIVKLHESEKELPPTYHCDSFASTERQASVVLRKWQDGVPRIEAGYDQLKHIYDRSIVDLAALRLHAEVEGNEFSLPAAGMPWFMAIFGRDTLVTSYQSLWVGPELAKGALQALAGLQGSEVNDFKDEEPGKILHEIRFGELTALGLRPHRPYYGTSDATPLWLILLSEYWRLTGDDLIARLLQPNAMRALEWIDSYGDRDGDGYVEYLTRSSQGLTNQGWKDSGDGVLFADGRGAEPPIAICEVQGYVYDAKLRMAEVAEKAWGEHHLATDLREQAGKLFDRFNDDFWIGSRGGFYALGLDRDKKRIDSMTSNMGHLLWTGIVPPERAKTIARHLLSDEMFTGWGIRTTSSKDAGYNPLRYHDGTVWPHDNSLIGAGLARYGFRDEANRIALAMFEAAAFTDHRLPEVFAGYPRTESRFPVRYPTACSPQAWATAAPFLWLRLLVGLDVRDGEVVCDPNVPQEIGRVSLHGIHVLGGHYDVEAEGTKGKVSVAG